jgi:hypothetical protein
MNREILELLIKELLTNKENDNKQCETNHPMLGKRCIIRTYSAGVHIGDITYINPNNSMEVKLENALRLWKWEDGGLSLSAVANNGIKGGRLNRTGEVYLTNAIEMIPTNSNAEATYLKFIED